MPLGGVLVSLCQHLYLHQIRGFGVKAAEIPWQMKGNRCPVVIPFLWGNEGLVWVGGWLLSKLSVEPTGADQPFHGLEVHLQLGKSEVKYFKVFIPTIASGQSVCAWPWHTEE